ncbi:hypothetical protein [Limnohabitans sp.]|uniref:hypothetical protein n=1 Tax=Limnohabitans sp. TaxID=1907725 RepID=UPI0031FC8913
MHIHWLAPISLDDPHQVYQTDWASLRLRAGALVSLTNEHLTISIGEQIAEHTHVCVVGKIGAHNPTEKQADWLKTIFKFDHSVVLDYTDDHIQNQTVMSDFYRIALERADEVVCSSQQLQKSITGIYSKKISVIEDAVEYLPLPPKTVPNKPRRLLWFGHHSNIAALQRFLRTFHPPMPVEVLVLSTEQGRQMLQTSPPPQSPSVRLLFKLWSIEEMPKAAAQCDACIIPVDDSSPAKIGASSNRLLTALTLGLPTCADLIPSYLEFQDFWTDLRGPQLDHVIMNPQAFHHQIELAQRHIKQHYSFQSLGLKWQATLEQLNAGPTNHSTSTSQT